MEVFQNFVLPQQSSQSVVEMSVRQKSIGSLINLWSTIRYSGPNSTWHIFWIYRCLDVANGLILKSQQSNDKTTDNPQSDSNILRLKKCFVRKFFFNSAAAFEISFSFLRFHIFKSQPFSHFLKVDFSRDFLLCLYLEHLLSFQEPEVQNFEESRSHFFSTLLHF